MNNVFITVSYDHQYPATSCIAVDDKFFKLTPEQKSIYLLERAKVDVTKLKPIKSYASVA